jgi:hypothetical protein
MRDFEYSNAIYSVGAKNYLLEGRCRFLCIEPKKKKYIGIRQNTPLFANSEMNKLITNVLLLLKSCRFAVFTMTLRQMLHIRIILNMRYLDENGMLPNNNDRYYAFLA